MFNPFAPNNEQTQPFNDKQPEFQAPFSQDYHRAFPESSPPPWGAQALPQQPQSLYTPFPSQWKSGEDSAQAGSNWGFANRSTESVSHRFSVSGDRGYLHHDLMGQALHHRASEPQLFRRMSYAGHEGSSSNGHANFSDMRLSSSHSTSSATSASSDYPTHPSPFESPFGHHPDDVVYSEPIPLSAEPLSLQPNNLSRSPESGGYAGSEYSANSDLVKNEESSPLMVPTQASSSRSPPVQIYRPSSSASDTSPLPQPATGIVVMHTDDAASKETQFLRRRCFNCHTTEPPSWRRSTLNTGKIVCNKCGLYERTHMRPRPPRFDEMRSGNPKIRKTTKSLMGAPPLSPNMKVIRGIKKEQPGPRQGGFDSRRSSFSSTTSDWDDNSLPYSNGGSVPSSAGYSSVGSSVGPDFGFPTFQQQQSQHQQQPQQQHPHPHPHQQQHQQQQQSVLHQPRHGSSPPNQSSTVESGPVRIPHPSSVPVSSNATPSFSFFLM